MIHLDMEGPLLPPQTIWWPHLNRRICGLMALDPDLPEDLRWIFFAFDHPPSHCGMCGHLDAHYHPAIDFFQPTATRNNCVEWVAVGGERPANPSPQARFIREFN